jgi:hypothetical protein
MIMSIIKDRVTATRDDSFCLFLIGMRINKFWKIHKWLPIFFQMPKMMKELESDKSLGYLGGESWFGRNIISVQYWESFEHLELLKLSKEHYRKTGTGRPTKKDRRDLEDYGINTDTTEKE